MVTYNISLNEELDELVRASLKSGCYANRSEFFRDLLRHHYKRQGIIVEQLSADDPDYKMVQKMKKRKKPGFLSFDEVMNEPT